VPKGSDPTMPYLQIRCRSQDVFGFLMLEPRGLEELWPLLGSSLADGDGSRLAFRTDRSPVLKPLLGPWARLLRSPSFLAEHPSGRRFSTWFSHSSSVGGSSRSPPAESASAWPVHRKEYGAAHPSRVRESFTSGGLLGEVTAVPAVTAECYG
jgi:hypothetical protein